MIAALRTLRRDGWVIGIAVAAALAYAVVSFVESLVDFLLALIEGTPVYDPGQSEVGEELLHFFHPPYTFEFRGHYVPYGDLVQAALLLLLVVPADALALHATRGDDDAPRDAA